MVTLNALKSIQFVVDASGNQAAVQVSMDDWRNLLDYFEELEDRDSIKQLLHRIKLGPEKAGALDWQESRKQW
jgi:hypothetical protein